MSFAKWKEEIHIPMLICELKNMLIFAPRILLLITDENMNKQHEIISYGFLFLLTTILSLQPFFQVGFSVGDDLLFYMEALRRESFSDYMSHAVHAGRFYYLLTKPFFYLAYYFDNFLITKIIQYASLFLSYILFTCVVQKIFRSKYVSLLILLLLILFTPISSVYHIPFISYPVYYTFSFSLILASLLGFLKYTETGKYKFVIISSVLFFLGALFYEVYILFLLFFGIYILIRSVRLRGFKDSFIDRNFYKEIVPFLVVGFVYLTLYFGFRAYIHTHYSGEDIYIGSAIAHDFSWKNFFTILFKSNISVSPAGMYCTHQYLFGNLSFLLSGHINNFGYILRNADAVAVVNALIQCMLFLLFFVRMKYDISWKKIIIGVILALFLALSSHILIGIAEKYNSSWYAWMQGYVTSYYAYFGIMLVYGLLCYALVKLCRKNKILKWTAIASLTMILFGYSIITNYANHHLARDLRHVQNRFFMMDEMLKTGEFEAIPDESAIYAPDLHKTVSSLGGGVSGTNLDWSDYIYYKSGKKLNVFIHENQFCDFVTQHPDKEIYTIEKVEAFKTNDILMVISHIHKKWEKENIPFDITQMFSNDINMYYYSPVKDFTFGFAFVDSTHSMIVKNGQDTIPTQQGINTIYVHSHNRRDKVTKTHLHSDGFFKPNYYFISILKTEEE